MGVTKYLKIKAGKRAYNRIMEEGLNPSVVSAMAAAAGGPKWIILYELDRYLNKEFFSDQEREVHFLGGSIGVWRSMCYLLDDPLDAIFRLREGYLNQRYDAPFSPTTISETCHRIILDALGDGGHKSILQHPTRKLHISTTRAHFNSEGRSDLFLKFRFGLIAMGNLFHRRSMNLSLSRHFFTTASNEIIADDGINSTISALNSDNLIPALRASGAIPVSMKPININGVEHWDGGIMDYHLDLKYKNLDGVVLYPHFLPFIRPGWFDKWTRLRYSKHHQDTVLLYPSEDFINMLPDRQLTSLQDFYTYKNDQDLRIKKWYEACEKGKYLVDDFVNLRDHSVLEENIETF
ncbi:MAG: hypothetical protein HKN68_14810 [Saprospiraceae bacterium]|nr:hypothetical protein [Saprospiraceae bacterium]